MPRVSVVIPSFNSACFLPTAIQSVLDQEYDDLEVIIVDDGSTDNTPEVVQGFTDARVRYVYHENRGLPAARNTGIDIARARYVAFLDADDAFLPGKTRAQVLHLDEYPRIGLVAGGHVYWDQHGSTIYERRPWESFPSLDIRTLLFHCPFIPSAVMVRKEWLERVGGFDETFRRVQDWELWLRLSHAGCRMDWTKQTVCAYRIHPNQATSTASVQKDAMIAVLDKFFSQDSLAPHLLELREKAYAAAYIRGAGREFARGEVEHGRRDVARAVALDRELLSDGGVDLLNRLLQWAGHAQTDDAVAHVERVFDHLPSEVSHLQSRRSKAVLTWALRRFFKAHESGEWKEVKANGLKAVRADPTALANLGVASILLEAYLGVAVMSRLRSFTHYMRDRYQTPREGTP